MAKNPETDNILSNIFTGMDIKLNADFDTSKSIKHKPSKGVDREEKLREILRDYLPKRFSVSSGAVVSSSGEQSDQLDIIIYDALEGFPLYGSDGNQLFPVECVYAVVEVKSSLTTAELNKCKKNILSIKKMGKTAYEQRWKAPQFTVLHGKPTEYFPVLGFVFAYDSSITLKTLKDKVIELDNKSDISMNIDSVYVLKKGAILNHVLPPADRYLMLPQDDSERIFVSSDKVLLLFYINISTVLTQAWMHPIKTLNYLPGVLFGNKNE